MTPANQTIKMTQTFKASPSQTIKFAFFFPKSSLIKSVHKKVIGYGKTPIAKTNGISVLKTENDKEIVLAMKLLAETEGIFTETAGGVTVGVTKKLVQQGRIKQDETTVICITGNGLKTVEALNGQYADPVIIEPKLNSFEEIYSNSVLTA